MIVSVQYLRGVAALMVVYAHVATQVLRYSGVDLPLYRFGHFGVDLFFVISGFIMWETTFDKGMAPWTFFYRRLTRIVPAYWLVTSVVVLVALFAPAALTSTRFELSHVLASYFFIPVRHPVLTDYYFPVLIVGWTLNYEMFFYLVFSMSLYVTQAWRVAAVVAALGCITLWGTFHHLEGAAGFYANAIILEVALGVVIGYVMTRRHRLPSMVAIPIAVAAFAAANYAALPRLFAFGLPAAFLVYALTNYEKHRGRVVEIGVLRLLGDASYSLYLTHALTLAVFAKAWVHAGASWGTPQIALFTGLALLSASLVGIAMYYCIEAPIYSFFRTYRLTNKARLGNTKA